MQKIVFSNNTSKPINIIKNYLKELHIEMHKGKDKEFACEYCIVKKFFLEIDTKW